MEDIDEEEEEHDVMQQPCGEGNNGDDGHVRDEESTASGMPQYDEMMQMDCDSVVSIAGTENELLVQVRSGLYVVLGVIGIVLAIAIGCSQRYQGHLQLEKAFQESIPKSDYGERQRAMSILLNELALLPEWPKVSWSLLHSHVETTSSHALFVLPVVTDAARDEYEAYSVEHESDWLQPTFATATQRRLGDMSAHIFNKNGTVAPGQTTMPVWQTAPARADIEPWINFDALSSNLPLQRVLESQQIVMSAPLFPPSSKSSIVETLLEGSPSASESSPLEPVEFILYPVMSAGNTSDVVAVVVSAVEWKFPGHLDVLIGSSCGANVSYSVGNDDKLHFDGIPTKPRRNKLQATIPFLTDNGAFKTDTSYCDYSISVSPSESMKHQHMTWGPLIDACVIVVVIILIGFAFSCYDELVEERQKVVMEHATQADTILSSLFPQQVRERLFRRGSDGPEVSARSDLEAEAPILGSVDGGIEPVSSHRIKNFLSKDDMFFDSADADRPIADLFPHCTYV